MYHHIAPLPETPDNANLFVTPGIFEQQLQYLKENHFKTLTIQEFYNVLKSGKNPVQKSVLLTFDDGHEDVYKNAFPLLKKYGFIGVFYIPTAVSEITNAHLKEMADAGMIIDSHSTNHISLRYIYKNAPLTIEIINSKSVIQKITGKEVLSFAYPFCLWNSTAVQYVSKAGYLVAFICDTSIDHTFKDRFVLSRIHAFNNLGIFESQLMGV
jgi:peptidoglycan/xylan/chitin deacetylase (PgdA/CDA1 family)